MAADANVADGLYAPFQSVFGDGLTGNVFTVYHFASGQVQFTDAGSGSPVMSLQASQFIFPSTHLSELDVFIDSVQVTTPKLVVNHGIVASTYTATSLTSSILGTSSSMFSSGTTVDLAYSNVTRQSPRLKAK